MTKKMKIIYIVAGLIICLIPLVFVGVSTSGTKENNGEIPSLTNEDKLNTRYLQEMGQWFTNNCGFRTEMVSLNSRIMADVFGVSSVDNITVGKNGWLYASATEESYKGNDNFSKREMFSIAHNVKLLENAVKAQGADFVFTIPANKNTLYPENMPYYIKKVGNNTNLLNISKLLAEEKVNYANMYDLFKSQEETLYLKMDSHWNGKGAVLAYNEIMSKARVPHNTYKEEAPVDTNYTGDLSNTAFPVFSKSENNSVYKTYGELDSKINVEGDSITTTCPAGTGKLLMYRDSFGNTLIPLMSSEFEVAHYSKTKSDYFTDYKVQNDITAYNPDVVVVEIVERHLKDFIYFAPEIESKAVKNVSSKKEKTSTNITIKAKDNFYVISGTADSKSLDEKSEFLIQITDNKGKTKTYPAFNMSFVKNGKQNDYGFKAYFSNDTIPKGKVEIKVLLKNNNNYTSIAEKTENIQKNYPLNSVFGVKDATEVIGSCKNVRSYEHKAVNKKDKGYVYLYNQSANVEEIYIKKSNSKSWSSNILEKNIKKGSKVTLYLPITQKDRENYDVKVKYRDNKTHTISKIPFYDISSLTLCREKNYSYITYLSVNSGESINTKNKELTLYQTRLAKAIAKKKAIEEAKRIAEEKRLAEEASIAESIAQEEAKRQAEYEAQQQAIAQAQQQEVQEEQTQPQTEPQQEPQATEPSVPQDNGCLSGIVLRDNNE